MSHALALPVRLMLAVWCALPALVACTNLDVLKQELNTVEYLQGRLQYALDPDATTVNFAVGDTGGRFRVADARLTFSSLALSAAVLEVSIATASVDLRNPLVEQMLRGEDWFDSNRVPLALFRSTGLRQQGEEVWLDGLLNLLGQNRPWNLRVWFVQGLPDLEHAPPIVDFEARGVFSRSAYGMTSLPNMAPDEVEIHVAGRLIRTEGSLE